MYSTDNFTINEMAGFIRRGQMTSVSLVEHYLNQIEARNTQINAVCASAPREKLLAEARTADLEAARGQTRGPLHGVPITIKDVCHVNGYQISRGIGELQGEASTHDATAVARLKAAGAIIIGITNVPELCMAFETENFVYGLTRNPHSLDRSAGGSSGGEAAAIAAGFSPSGLASDACGSIRLPAHFNGICGLKLTQGRVPLTGQFPNERSGLFHLTSAFGALGRYVDDIETLGKLLCGPDGYDPDTVEVPFYRAKPLNEMRIATYWKLDNAVVSSTVRSALKDVTNILEPVVAQIRSDHPAGMKEASDVLWRIFITGGDSGRGWKSMFEAMGKDQFTPALGKLIEFAEENEMSVDEVRRDWVMIDTFRYQLAAFFDRYDALITPVYTDVAFSHGESMNDPNRYDFVFPFSLSGSPAVVVPAGTDSVTGLPIGVQIVGPHWHENQLLDIARHIERQLGGWKKANML